MNTRSRVLLCITVVFASLAALSPTASANSLILDLGTYQSGVGGEFNAYSANLNPTAMGYSSTTMENIHNHGMGFSTFCLEYNEEFIPGGTYNYTIGQAAIHGGIANGSDPISLGTAWLYLNFAEGTLAGYNFTNSGPGPSRTTDAGLLQDTIWWLEGERPDPGTTNPFRQLVLSQFGNNAMNAMADNNGFYGVAVLNLYYLDGRLSQDQLVLVPDSGTTAVLLGVGLLVLFLFHRKVTRQKSKVLSSRRPVVS